MSRSRLGLVLLSGFLEPLAVRSDLSSLCLRSLPHSPWTILQNQAYRPPQALAGAKLLQAIVQ
jgi:hypothetical protein